MKASDRTHWLRLQIAHNIVQLVVHISRCNGRGDSGYPMKWAYLDALSTQRHTLKWLDQRDRRAIIELARDEMKEVRRSRATSPSYAFVKVDAPVIFEGRRTRWCHVAMKYAFTADVVAIASQLQATGSAIIDGRPIVLDKPQAQAA